MIGDILQPTHLIFILVVALLVLGPKRLPEAGRALGKGLRDFRSAMSGEEDHRTEIPTATPSASPGMTYNEPQASSGMTYNEPQASPGMTYDAPEVTPFDEPAAPTPPPADHAIQAAVYAATPAVDSTAASAEQRAESTIG
jgi:sec-independent protein translocase protein TatA